MKTFITLGSNIFGMKNSRVLIVFKEIIKDLKPKIQSNLFSIFVLDRRFSSVFFRTRYYLTRQNSFFHYRQTL